MSLIDKVAIVTGASRGIGSSIALRLGQEGAFVIVNYKNSAEKAARVVEQIEQQGGKAIALQTDVGSYAEIEQFYHTVEQVLTKRFGNSGIDILVNNAGLSDGGSLSTISEDDLERVFAVNLKGPLFMIQRALPFLREGARIINISSGIARRPDPRASAYAMSKAALNVLTLVAAMELGKRNITVNTLVPGWTNTDINVELLKNDTLRSAVLLDTALGRIGETSDIADAVVLLISPQGRWITGQYIEVSGGYKLHT